MCALKHPWLLFASAVGVAIVTLFLFSRWAAATQTSSPVKPDFANVLLEQLPLADAHTRLPFHILQPTYLAGYHLATVQIPRHQPSHVELIYADANQRHVLLLGEAAIDQAAFPRGPWGSTEPVTINGNPALYVNGVPMQKDGESQTAIDSSVHGVIFDHDPVRIQLYGWSSAGVNRELLIKIAESLQ